MSGPPPKDSWARRRANAPAGGEWVELVPLDHPVLPALPRRSKAEGGAWSPWARKTWEAWRADPATGQFSAADVQYALDTLFLIDHFGGAPSASLAAEIRLRTDGLGLSPKGKRNLRWRLSEPAEVVPLRSGPVDRHADKRRRRLMAVDPEEGTS